VILLAGVNGVGKTTVAGKLAGLYGRQGKRVVLVAADTFRAAAGEQLEHWGRRVGAEVVRDQAGGDPAAVAYDGVAAAQARKADVVLVDTAGRLHTKSNLMDELRKVKRTLGKAMPGAPHDVWLILDATVGQNGLAQARQFHEALGVTGVILTKLDGTAKGGIVLAVAGELGLPVRYIGVGEGVEDLQAFEPEAFVDALLEES
jgi:fused signal recognition particle receptor